jgi:hypothetical protein
VPHSLALCHGRRRNHQNHLKPHMSACQGLLTQNTSSHISINHASRAGFDNENPCKLWLESTVLWSFAVTVPALRIFLCTGDYNLELNGVVVRSWC